MNDGPITLKFCTGVQSQNNNAYVAVLGLEIETSPNNI